MALQAYLSSASASARDRRAGDDCSVCWPRLRLRRASERTDVTFIVLMSCLLRAVLRRLYPADNNTSSLFYSTYSCSLVHSSSSSGTIAPV